jgi:hypothetical protein
MDMPTYEIVPGENGQPCYELSYESLSVAHPQLWQAEAMLQQLAASSGVSLPVVWYCRQLGRRSLPVMRDLDGGRIGEPGT